jgi:hypothetical protein
MRAIHKSLPKTKTRRRETARRPDAPRRAIKQESGSDNYSDYQSEDSLEDFIVEDEGLGEAQSMLRQITGYDPRRYQDMDRGRVEESNAHDIF